ncbi:Hint domain-containing protein, partial [Acetobacter malorum]|uniref:Hint domain-containing protein n=1 Tax=Acetobacter malorum TaxID=178901 RepID=UPI00211AD187
MSDYPLPAATRTISAGQTVNGASYSTPDHVVVEGTLTDATLSQNGGGIGSILVQSGGILSGVTVTSGGNIFALSGGNASNISLDGSRSADLIVENGGNVDTVKASNSAGIDLRGGTLSNVTLTTSASMNVESGGSVNGVSVGDTAQVDVGAHSQVSSITVFSGGAVGNLGGAITSATIETGGNISVERGYSYNATTSSGGYSDGTIDEAVIKSGGTLTVGNGGSATNIGLKNGGLIDFSTLTYDSSAKYSYDADTYTLTVTGNGETASVTLDPKTSDIVDGQQFNLVNDGDTLAIETCFLAGSMIQTPNGDVPVEKICVGDVITTYVNDKEDSRSVIWAGKVHATVRSELKDDEAGYPVRVLKDAVADGVPYKDMLITAEHCLFFEGRFVPVRMLVNGVSIFYDKSITSYDYYHVETEQHSVIRADGMLTESYLDTGNRSTFRQNGKVVVLRAAGARSWEADAAAPLCVGRNFVEALFRALEARGNLVENCQKPAASVTTTHDADLHLVMKNGAVIRPIRHD